ncbi:hypothetical protein TPHA_0F02590 [Tetrapisispora phaffii CBS 4417]|uniref:Mediator of RNA polymerase II transcription subunit 4 n=1 Tax=Tetrapisispora phaffii (strain ATCC 24235 / CBS 4417 / NBRC 1672 / NRRL Y-8282 / UCD 70-5) TaxID=1071381 RepID=G8BUF3_TETPH|nr:hypothetical protein TPHA_0F02590 [Tetrapisispora phaffii CBS 4417]CCE63739.1 hypothetical protein TPHA_0F02590 [Tetrapisispora phaffii CBS 4417]
MSNNYNMHGLNASEFLTKSNAEAFNSTLTPVAVPQSTANNISQGTASNMNTAAVDSLANVAIYNDIKNYEDTLIKLVSSIDNFRPDVEVAKTLIEVDKRLYKNLGSFKEYDEIDTKISKIKDDSEKLDLQTKHILDILNDSRNMLNSLPMLEEIYFERDVMHEKQKKINSKILLDYATKISKFTKIPPTFNKGSIGPNNFIWPAEDALRRGMLAVASIHRSELTKLPNDTSYDSDKELEEQQEQEQHGTENTREADVEQEQEESFVFDGKHKNEEKTENSNEANSNDDNENDNMDLDLELFNPDEF